MRYLTCCTKRLIKSDTKEELRQRATSRHSSFTNFNGTPTMWHWSSRKEKHIDCRKVAVFFNSAFEGPEMGDPEILEHFLRGRDCAGKIQIGDLVKIKCEKFPGWCCVNQLPLQFLLLRYWKVIRSIRFHDLVFHRLKTIVQSLFRLATLALSRSTWLLQFASSAHVEGWSIQKIPLERLPRA